MYMHTPFEINCKKNVRYSANSPFFIIFIRTFKMRTYVWSFLSHNLLFERETRKKNILIQHCVKWILWWHLQISHANQLKLPLNYTSKFMSTTSDDIWWMLLMQISEGLILASVLNWIMALELNTWYRHG